MTIIIIIIVVIVVVVVLDPQRSRTWRDHYCPGGAALKGLRPYLWDTG